VALLHVDAVDPCVTLLLLLDAVGPCVLLMRRRNEVAVASAAVLVTVCVQPGIVPFIWGRRQFVLFKVIFQELLQRLSALRLMRYHHVCDLLQNGLHWFAEADTECRQQRGHVILSQGDGGRLCALHALR